MSVRRTFVVLALLAPLSLGACGRAADAPSQNVDAAKKQVTAFHGLLDRNAYGEIYASSDDAYKKAATRPESDRFLQGLRTRYGVVKAATLQASQVTTTVDGTFAVLAYRTHFQHGDVDERFTWRQQEPTPALVGFRYQPSATRPRR